VVAKGKWLLVDRWLRTLDNFNVTKLLDHIAGVVVASSGEQDCASICTNVIMDAMSERSAATGGFCFKLSSEDVYNVEQSLNKHAFKMKNANLSQMVRLIQRLMRMHRICITPSPFFKNCFFYIQRICYALL
jgi:hypothetical protein